MIARISKLALTLVVTTIVILSGHQPVKSQSSSSTYPFFILYGLLTKSTLPKMIFIFISFKFGFQLGCIRTYKRHFTINVVKLSTAVELWLALHVLLVILELGEDKF